MEFNTPYEYKQNNKMNLTLIRTIFIKHQGQKEEFITLKKKKKKRKMLTN